MRRINCLAFSLVALAVSGAAAPGGATAIMSGDASFFVDIPGAVNNAFGFARIGPTFSGGSGFTGNASASHVFGTTTISFLDEANQPAGGAVPDGDDNQFPGPDTTGVRVSVSGMEIDGQADPDGTALANSSATVTFNFGNLTGSGGPTPPGQVIEVPVSGSYTFSLGALAGGCVLCDEEASASFLFVATLGGQEIDRFFEQVDADFFDPTIPFNYLLSLPANSVTPFVITATLDGSASSAAVEKEVPEPGTLSLAAFGLMSLVWLRRRRRAA